MNNIRVGNLFGIPFYVNPSWFLVLGLVTLNYGSGLAAQFPLLPGGVAWLLGLGTALLLFGSVLAHELGHSFVALSQGIGVRSITLFLFGGLANLERESKTPAGAFWVAIAGPLVSLAIAITTTIAVVFSPISGAPAAILGVLASVNFALAFFNLIPGLPLDGGNILKAIVWKITGNPYRGMQFAGRVGQAFGWLAIASGLLPILFGGGLSFWNVLIGWFLLQNAGQAAQYGTVQNQLAGLTAADAVIPHSPIVDENLSLRELVDQSILSTHQWRKFLVTDGNRQLVGMVSMNDIKDIPLQEWSRLSVKAIVQPLDPALIIESDRPLSEVIQVLEERQISTLSVVQRNGTLIGLLEKAAIVQLLNQQMTPPSPA
ncbi:MAG: site-2 protease family protein [Prochlorotrichaceae cyanobacterium]|jgi:Zn-dependent protease/CBS domain-containing protein